MFRLKKILKDNNIKYYLIYHKLLGIPLAMFNRKIVGTTDFTIKELTLIRDYLASQNVVPLDYDIGLLLDIV